MSTLKSLTVFTVLLINANAMAQIGPGIQIEDQLVDGESIILSCAGISRPPGPATLIGVEDPGVGIATLVRKPVPGGIGAVDLSGIKVAPNDRRFGCFGLGRPVELTTDSTTTNSTTATP